MARNINDIQRDIDRNRRNLAQTLDEIIDRAKPTNVAGDVKTVMVAKLQDPEIQKNCSGRERRRGWPRGIDHGALGEAS